MAKEVPVGVKIISVLSYLWAVLNLISFFILLVAYFQFPEIIQAELPSILQGWWMFGLFLLLLLGLSVLYLFIGLGLWKGASWARTIAMILAVLGVVQYGISLARGSYIAGSVMLLVNLAILGYLLLHPEVKAAFSEKRKGKK